MTTQPIERDSSWLAALGLIVVLILGALALYALSTTVANAQTPCVVGGPDACFSSSAAPGPAPLSTTLTWNVPSATACTAGGAGSVPAWTGSVPKSGTRTLTSIGVDMTLTLNCTGPGKATLSWTHDGKYTDGTPVTLAGFTVLYGTSATALTQTVLVNVPGATAFTVDNLAAGSWSFAVRARDTAGAESVNSNVATKTVTGFTFNATQLVDVTAVPSAPTGVVVTEVTAIDVRQNADGTLYAVNAPMVPVSTRCAGNDCTVLARRQ